MRARLGFLARRARTALPVAVVSASLAACAPARPPMSPSSLTGAAREGVLTLTLRAAPGAHFTEGTPCDVDLHATGATLPRATLALEDAHAPDARTRAFTASYTLPPRHPSVAEVRARARFFTCTATTCTREEQEFVIPLLASEDVP